MKEAKIVLGGQEYTIGELKARENSKWLKQVEGPLMEAAQVILQAQEADLDDLQSIGTLITTVARILIGSIDTVIDLLIQYAPDLKDAIEGAYTSEIFAAFVEVVKLAFPFVDLLRKLGELRSLGSPGEETGTSSPSASGESGQTSSTTT